MRRGEQVSVRVTTRLINPNGPTDAVREHVIQGVVESFDDKNVTLRFANMTATFPVSSIVTTVRPDPKPAIAASALDEQRVAEYLSSVLQPKPAKLEVEKSDDEPKDKSK